MSYVIGVDIGGTCTDCVVVDETGRLTVAKAFSTPADFSRGIFDAVTLAAGELGLDLGGLLGATALFLHGTTVAENAIVDGTLAPAGLLVTRGFEETLFMSRGGYGRWSGLTEEEKKHVLRTDKPEPLMASATIRGIRERTNAQGGVVAEADEAEIDAAVGALVERGAQAIGVCFLWSFRNPANEAVVRHVMERRYPDVFFTMSSELAPIEGEYERTSTVALNARLGPIVSRYLASVRARLEAQGFRGALLVMQAHGGLLRVEDAPARAVGMIESGPVGGLVGSKAIGDSLGFSNILATDMGGTTFKAGVIREGRIDYEREPRVVRYHYALHKMEVVSIGLAGGSIVSLDPGTGLPRIGPRSAGASPGPVAYGFGGEEPTITDVDVLLGYLDPRFFLGGRATLDRARADAAFRSAIADRLGLEPLRAASAVYRLANSLVYDLLHKQTVEKGLDPRDYTLFAYGGTAGMHMAAIGQELGVRRIVIPHSASVHGAFGVVSADVVQTDVTTRTLRVPVEPDEVNAIFARLTRRVADRLLAAGFLPEDIVVQRSINMRYRRQVHVLTTPVDGDGVLTPPDLEKVSGRFEEIYAERYGKDAGYREAGLEMVAFLARGVARLRKPHVRPAEPGPPDPRSAFVESRVAYFGGVDEMREAHCYDFQRLRPGHTVAGPAIVWTPITTVVVQPGQTATCDPWKNLVVTW